MHAGWKYHQMSPATANFTLPQIYYEGFYPCFRWLLRLWKKVLHVKEDANQIRYGQYVSHVTDDGVYRVNMTKNHKNKRIITPVEKYSFLWIAVNRGPVHRFCLCRLSRRFFSIMKELCWLLLLPIFFTKNQVTKLSLMHIFCELIFQRLVPHLDKTPVAKYEVWCIFILRT